MIRRGFALRGATATAMFLAFVQCVGSDPAPITPISEDGGNTSSSSSSGSSGSSGLVDGGSDGAPAPEGNYTRSFVLSPAGDGAPIIAVDPSNNIYIAISYGKLGVTLGTKVVTKPLGSDSDIAVAKLSPDGSTAEWVATITGADEDEPTALALDPSGNVYVTGSYRSKDLDVNGAVLGRGTATTSEFIAKLNAKDGKTEWAKALKIDTGDGGGIASTRGAVVRVTPKGQLAFGCSFRGSLDYGGPAPASFSTIVGSVVGVLDASNGVLLSSQVIASNVSGSRIADGVYVRGVEVDRDDHFYLVGYTTMPVVTVGAKQLTGSASDATGAALILQLKPDLSETIWHRVFGGPADGGGLTQFADLALDGPATYALGSFTAASNFGLGPVNAVSKLTSDVVAVKLSSSDGTPKWAKTLGGPSNDTPGGIAVDPWGRPVLSAGFQNLNNTSIDGQALPNGNAFLVTKLDPADGKILYLHASGAASTTAGNVVTRPDGHSLVTATFSGSIKLDATQTPDASTGAFVADLTP